jgi:peroxiredoxin
MTLNQELTQFAQGLAQHLSADQLQVFSQHLQLLADTGITQSSLKPGNAFPRFTLPNATGQPIASDTLLKQGPMVVTFYRGAWCPFCNLQLRAMQQLLPQLKAAGASLVAISPQTPDHSLDMAQKNSLEYEVLSDIGNAFAKQLGLVYRIDDAFQQLQGQTGVSVPDYNGDPSFELSATATFVVRPDGTIAYAHVDTNFTQRPEPADILKAVQHLATPAFAG